jgi:hypothetical protein
MLALTIRYITIRYIRNTVLLHVKAVCFEQLISYQSIKKVIYVSTNDQIYQKSTPVIQKVVFTPYDTKVSRLFSKHHYYYSYHNYEMKHNLVLHSYFMCIQIYSYNRTNLAIYCWELLIISIKKALFLRLFVSHHWFIDWNTPTYCYITSFTLALTITYVRNQRI